MHQLAAPAFAEIEIKKSRFLGQLYPLQTRAEALAKLAEIRMAHPGAVHVCWALLCAGDSGLDDDGEPSGTAAKPMYNVLVHKDLTNVLAVVVRYWGGTKLGAGGLTRAYGQAISEACKLATLIAVEAMTTCVAEVSFADESHLRRLAEQHSAQITDTCYEQAAILTLQLKASQYVNFCEVLTDSFKGQVQMRRIDEPS